jgi:hypothetical protein
MALYGKVAQLLTSSEWTVSVLARRSEILGIDISSSYPFLVKAVISDSLGAQYGIMAGDQLLSIGNETNEISDIPNIRVVLLALKNRPIVVRFRRFGEILCPRLEAPIEPPAVSLVAPPVPSLPLPGHHKKSLPPAIVTAALGTPPSLVTPAIRTGLRSPGEEKGPQTPRASPRMDEEEEETQYVKASEEYADDFDH